MVVIPNNETGGERIFTVTENPSNILSQLDGCVTHGSFHPAVAEHRFLSSAVKETTKKVLEPISEFSKDAGYEINTQH